LKFIEERKNIRLLLSRTAKTLKFLKRLLERPRKKTAGTK
jgi:hypothetical protein